MEGYLFLTFSTVAIFFRETNDTIKLPLKLQLKRDNNIYTFTSTLSAQSIENGTFNIIEKTKK